MSCQPIGNTESEGNVFNKQMLLSACAEVGMTPTDCKKALHMADRTWKSRMCGERDWKLGEIDILNNELEQRGWRGNPSRIWFYGSI